MHAATADARFAAAVAARWPVALVDEFQDTDPQQWAIFRRLYEAGAARAESGEAEPPLLGLVGDPKQAIYAFRGGDLDTYLVAREYVREHGGEDSLDTNYRSRPAVLGAIEALFTRSEEHTSELQSLMRISYAVFCLKKKMYSCTCSFYA